MKNIGFDILDEELMPLLHLFFLGCLEAAGEMYRKATTFLSLSVKNFDAANF